MKYEMMVGCWKIEVRLRYALPTWRDTIDADVLILFCGRSGSSNDCRLARSVSNVARGSDLAKSACGRDLWYSMSV